MTDDFDTGNDEAKKVYEQYLNDLRWLMGETQGRRIMWELQSKGKVFQTTFRPNSEMQFLEGRRSLALEFLHDVLNADLFDEWTLMHREALAREVENSEQSSTDS